MNKREITAKQVIAAITFFLAGSSLVAGGTSMAQQDSWISIVLAFLATIPMTWVYSEILLFSPKRDLYDAAVFAAGKPAAKILCALYAVYALYVGALVIRIFSEFIHIVNMLETPIIAITAAMMLSCIYLSTKRLYVLGRVAKFTLPFLFLSISITIIFSLKDMDIINLLPVLYNNTKPVIKTAVVLIAIPFGETVICMPMFAGVEHQEKIFPIFFKGLFLGFLFLLAANLRNTLVLGYSASLFDFPSYEAVSVISIGDFFTRIEVFIGINLLLAGFIKICVSIYSSCFYLSKAFGYDDYAKLSAPCGLIIITLGILAHSNSEEMFSWLNYHPFYSLPFQVVIPLILFIIGKIKQHSLKAGGSAAAGRRAAS